MQWSTIERDLERLWADVRYGSGAQAELAGILTVTTAISYLSAPGRAHEPGGHVLILLNDLAQRLQGIAPGLWGGMVIHSLPATVRGGFVKVELPMFVAALMYVDAIEIEDTSGARRVVYAKEPPASDQPAVPPPAPLPLPDPHR